MGQRSDWSKKVLSALDNGEWHLLEPVVLDAMRLVPPGTASREGIRCREHGFLQHQRRNGRPEAPREKADDDLAALISVGARSKVMKSVYEMRRGKIIETTDLPNGDRVIRKVPDDGSNLLPFKATSGKSPNRRVAAAL